MSEEITYITEEDLPKVEPDPAGLLLLRRFMSGERLKRREQRYLDTYLLACASIELEHICASLRSG